MKSLCKALVIFFPAVYIIATVYVAYRLLYGSGLNHGPAVTILSRSVVQDVDVPALTSPHPPPALIKVEVWGKAAISIYLWQHILNGELHEVQGGFVKEGSLSVDDIEFTFRWGPGIIQSTVPANAVNLILILNGRSADKISIAQQWLNYLPLYTDLKHTVIILLGDEHCKNEWILPYMRSRGGLVDAVLVVYDSPLVDNIEFFQWPLGVATYRGFPDHSSRQDIDLTSPRSHLCNFLGTIYPNSSRQTLAELLEKPQMQDQCIVRGREKWVPVETEESLRFYLSSLLKSDLTLNPAGMNTECYRIYEALSMGSIPVVEDVVTGSCDSQSKESPLRLLKKYKAPLLFIKDWRDLPAILHRESQRTLSERVERRVAAVRWYAEFKKTMKQELIRILRRKMRISNS